MSPHRSYTSTTSRNVLHMRHAREEWRLANSQDAIATVFTLGIAALSSVYALYRKKRQLREQQQRMIPVRRWPLIGHYWQVGSTHHLAAVAEAWADEHGSESGYYQVDLAGVCYLVVCRADTALELLRKRPYSVIRSVQISEACASVGDTSVFCAEGEEWKREHALVAAALNQNHIQEYLVVMKEVVGRLVRKWKSQCCEDNAVVAIYQDLTNAAMDAICLASLDHDFDFLNQHSSQVARDIQTIMDGLVARTLWPIWYWRIPFIGQYLDGRGFAIRRVLKLLHGIVDAHDVHKDDSKQTFLQKILVASRNEKRPLAKDRVVGNILGLLDGGTDTTSKTMTTALYLLATNLELQEELRAECDSIDIEQATLRQLYTILPKMKSFLHEVHRCYGVPLNMLETAKDIAFCGSKLPRGTNIMLLQRYISMHSSVPGDELPRGPLDSDPAEFCPKRWLVEVDGEWRCPSPSNKSIVFLPFGYGARSCPGRSYSEAFSYLILASLLQNFEWTLAPEHPVPKFIFDVTMVPDCEIRLSLKKRERPLNGL